MINLTPSLSLPRGSNFKGTLNKLNININYNRNFLFKATGLSSNENVKGRDLQDVHTYQEQLHRQLPKSLDDLVLARPRWEKTRFRQIHISRCPVCVLRNAGALKHRRRFVASGFGNHNERRIRRSKTFKPLD